MTQSLNPNSPNFAKGRIAERLKSALRAAPQVAAFLNSVEEANKTWAIVGGAPRMWALGDPDDPRDIDIVVGATPELVESLVMRSSEYSLPNDPIEVSRTKLGGYRLRTHNHLFDVWPARSSVGIRKSEVTERTLYRRVAQSAALSIDSLVFTCHGTLHDNGFFETLSTGVMKLNHCRVESPEAMATKAIRLCRKYRLYPELSLQGFVASVMDGPSNPQVDPELLSGWQD